MTSILGIAFVAGGLTGAFLTGLFLSKTKKYKLCNIIICVGSLVITSLFMAILQFRSPALCYIVAGFLGFFVVSSLSLGLDFGCEVSYPVPANNVTGVMISYSMLVSAIHILLANVIFSSGNEQRSISKEGEANIMIGLLIGTKIGRAHV